MTDRWEDYFVPGERLIWEGQPQQGRWATLSTIGLAAFGMPFLLAGLAMTGGPVLALFGLEVGLEDAGSTSFLFFFGLPFLGMGAGMVFGPAYALRNSHQKFRYALSDQRAYIATHWWSQRMEVLPVAPASGLELNDGKDVYFHTVTQRDSDGNRLTERKGFESIADAPRVYQLLRSMQEARDD